MKAIRSYRNIAHAILLSATTICAQAQKKVEITFEDLKTRCDSAPPAQRVARLYAEAFARPPAAAELSAALTFLDEQQRAYGGEKADAAGLEKAWADLCHVLFNVKEFVFVN